MQKRIEDWTKRNNDKMLHFIAGLLMSLLIVFSWWLLLLPIGVGIVKELIDKYVRKTKFDVKDMFATWFSAVPVAIVVLIEKLIM